ncbi:TPA: class I SAM-dependent methyltransferase [Serratia marcescens]|nr:class I SAM-dependent methyltransferase [Serratia marcescens]
MINNYRLPSDYNSRLDFDNYIDGHDSLDNTIYQPLVYKSAFELVKKTNAKYLIDIGCGDGGKVKEVKNYKSDCKIILIDHEYIINNVVKKYDGAQYISADFDIAIPEIDEEILKEAVIVCSDVIEHLAKPEILLEFFFRCKKWVKAIVVSTPDRVEERGYFDYGPPANPYHVREWTQDEFTRLLMDYGFTDRMLCGLTISNDHSNVKATLLCIMSKYLEIKVEDDEKVKTETLKCAANIFPSTLASDVKKNIICQDEKFENECWYILESEMSEYVPLNLRLPFVNMLTLAESNGFNVLSKSVVEMETQYGCASKTGGANLLVHNDGASPIAAIKGELLNRVISGKEMEIRNYPFNILSLIPEKKKSLFSFFKKDTPKKLPLGAWHDNIVRKDFIVELMFGGDVK